jgi:hypothetical protein
MVETHKDCSDVTILENIVKDVKTSDIFNEMEQLINEMGHHTSDGLEIWWISHIPQKDGELDMLLISCNILYVLKCKLTLSNGHQSF